MKTFYKLTLASCLAVLLASCKTAKPDLEASSSLKASDQIQFFENLSKLCGQQFIGSTVFPDDPNHDFAGKKLVAKIATCEDAQIRIPFSVGEDHSRTWIISKTEQGLLLKHDHRHHDGTPDDITLYGGYAKDYQGQSGSAYQQFFHADAHTAKLIPAAASNVWMLKIEPQEKALIYYLERHQKPRYKAKLLQTKP